jgi:DNA (cytosine-5)-methyltransferase 1
MRAYDDGSAPGLKVGTGLEMGWAPAICVRTNQTGANGIGVSDAAYAVQATGGADAIAFDPTPVATSAVRRLTPVECERLQGFPDGWTCLCTPLEAYAADPEAAALACTCPDGPRYRALGNAVTVNVIAWLGQRLREANP